MKNKKLSFRYKCKIKILTYFGNVPIYLYICLYIYLYLYIHKRVCIYIFGHAKIQHLKFWNSKIKNKHKNKKKKQIWRSEIIRCWQVLGTLAK